MSIPPIIRDNFLSAICTATLVVPTTFFLTKTLIYEPKIEQLESKNKDMSSTIESFSKDISTIDSLNENLNSSKLKISSLSLKINDLEKKNGELTENIVKISRENTVLKESDAEMKANNLNYIRSQVEMLKQEKLQIRNPTSIQVVYGGKSSFKELSSDDRALEEQLQSQINNLQNKLMCTN